MKKIHLPSLKIHTIFSLALAVVLLAVIIIAPSISLFAVALFVVLYISGNGIIHSKKNELKRDTLVEYILVSIIVIVVVIGAVS